jgi:DNA-binding MarR family transcriptional regulator
MAPRRRPAEPPAERGQRDAAQGITRDDLGFLLAKATQRWNEVLKARFTAAGFADVRPSYGSILVPLFEEDGLRLTELAQRARLSKQTMTTMVRLLERDGLVTRRADPHDGRAALVFLTQRGRRLQPVAASILSDLDGRAQHRLTAAGVDELKASLRALMELMP